MADAIRVHISADDAGAVTGKVTAHAPYAAASTAGHTPIASADVCITELENAGPLREELAALLAKIRDAALPRLKLRLGDAVFAARAVGIVRQEIER